MYWGKNTRRNYWICAVKRRASIARYKRTKKGRVSQQRSHAKTNPKRIEIGGMYVGMEHHFPVDRETVISHLNNLRQDLLDKQAAEREAFNESFAR